MNAQIKTLDTFYQLVRETFSSELPNPNLFTFSAEDNSFISRKFGHFIASTDSVKRKSIKLFAVKDPEVSAFIWWHDLTSVVAQVKTEQKRFKKGNWQVYHKNIKIFLND